MVGVGAERQAEKENRGRVGEVGEMHERSQRVQTSNGKKVRHGDYG